MYWGIDSSHALYSSVNSGEGVSSLIDEPIDLLLLRNERLSFFSFFGTRNLLK